MGTFAFGSFGFEIVDARCSSVKSFFSNLLVCLCNILAAGFALRGRVELLICPRSPATVGGFLRPTASDDTDSCSLIEATCVCEGV